MSAYFLQPTSFSRDMAVSSCNKGDIIKIKLDTEEFPKIGMVIGQNFHGQRQVLFLFSSGEIYIEFIMGSHLITVCPVGTKLIIEQKE